MVKVSANAVVDAAAVGCRITRDSGIGDREGATCGFGAMEGVTLVVEDATAAAEGTICTIARDSGIDDRGDTVVEDATTTTIVCNITREGRIGDREGATVDTDTTTTTIVCNITRDGGIGDGKVAAIVEDTSASIA